MILFPLQGSVGDKDGKVAVLHLELLDLRVDEVLDDLPDGEGPGTQDVAARDVVVLHHLGLDERLAVPVREVLSLLGLQPQAGHSGDRGHGLDDKGESVELGKIGRRVCGEKEIMRG